MGPLFSSGNPWDPEKNSYLCSILGTVSPGAQGGYNILQTIPDFLTSQDRVVIVPRGSGLSAPGIAPSFMVAYSNTETVVAFGGTDFSVNQLEALISGYSNPWRPESMRGGNGGLAQGVMDWGNNALNPYLASDPSNTTYVLGHSYGGVFAQLFAKRLKSLLPNRVVKVWTYGAPRPGNLEFARSAWWGTNFRWWGTDDPVRYIPPHIDESPWLAVMNGLILQENLDTQVQTGSGAGISPAGNITDGTGDPGNEGGVAYSLYAWLTGQHGLANPVHTIASYKERFDLAYRNAFVPPVPPSPPAQSQPSVRPRRDEERIIEENRIPALNALGNGGGGPVVVDPTQGTGGTSPTRYRLRKVGRVWCVQWLGRTVAIGPGKRHAKSLRRQMNRTLTQVAM